MKFKKMENSSLRCETSVLTIDDVQELNRTTFVERVPVVIHCLQIHQQALIPFLAFISGLKCLDITIYVEQLDHQTARTICHFARQNVHALKMHVDLGEKILGFFSVNQLSEDEARDINDHLICGIYKKLHTLIIQYKTMKYIEACDLRNALLKAPLQSLEIRLNHLDEATQNYLADQLTSWIYIPETHLIIDGHEQILQQNISVTATSSDTHVGISSIPAIEEVEADSTPEGDLAGDAELNCLQKAFTWMWSMVGRQNPSTPVDDSNRRTNHHRLH